MKYWLGVTDNSWYSFQERQQFDEINFWQPSATPPFKNALEGMPFLFKLKKPYNHIAGGGFFVTYSTLPIKIAWDVFGAKNGVDSLSSLKSILSPLTGAKKSDSIGCTILADPFFFEEDDWIKTPPSFSLNIVRGKMYDTLSPDGDYLWNQVSERLKRKNLLPTSSNKISDREINEPVDRYGKSYLIKPRIGQSSFRLLVTDAYSRRCAMTGESTLPVLDAAHIIPYSEGGTHDISNGLLLRADFHKLYDAGLVSITPDYLIKISPEIREAWFNGKAYYKLQDQKPRSIPEIEKLKPNKDYLETHFREKFIR